MDLSIEDRYSHLCKTKSDINEHLPILYALARECFSIAELGVRGVVSTWAFLAGLKVSYVNYADMKRMVCVDIVDIPLISDVSKIALEQGDIDLKFIKGDSAIIDLPYIDLLFIDTWHIYGHLRRELYKHAPRTKKYIVMHDTEVDAKHGECLRVGMDIMKACQESGYSKDDVTCGLQRAIDEFLLQYIDEWELHKVYKNNNGLTILKRKNNKSSIIL